MLWCCGVDGWRYLGEGDEQELLMGVLEPREGSLWAMLPHPLLIGLVIETLRWAQQMV